MPYVYEGDAPTRVNGVRYAPGATTDSEDVKNKEGFRKISSEESADLAKQRPGTFADAKPTAWEGKFSDALAWMGQASVAAPLNVVVGDNEAPFGPPTGTITTKQAVMRDASSSAERLAFGDHEWLPEDAEERNLGESTSGTVQAAQAEVSGRVEAVTDDLINEGEDGGTDEPDSSAGTTTPTSTASASSTRSG
jgi:hypothetical protein